MAALKSKPIHPRHAETQKNAQSIEVQALTEALASRQMGLFLRILNDIARARGMSSLARQTGMRREVLYVALEETRNPTLGTILALLDALGIELRAEASYQSAERSGNS